MPKIVKPPDTQRRFQDYRYVVKNLPVETAINNGPPPRWQEAELVRIGRPGQPSSGTYVAAFSASASA
jgi:hypothetical protein